MVKNIEHSEYFKKYSFPHINTLNPFIKVVLFWELWTPNGQLSKNYITSQFNTIPSDECIEQYSKIDNAMYSLLDKGYKIGECYLIKY